YPDCCNAGISSTPASPHAAAPDPLPTDGYRTRPAAPGCCTAASARESRDRGTTGNSRRRCTESAVRTSPRNSSAAPADLPAVAEHLKENQAPHNPDE